MIIDAHGHYTTVPPGLRVFRALQISKMGRPTKGAVNVSDDEIRESLEKGQVRLLNERGIDVSCSRRWPLRWAIISVMRSSAATGLK